jgi:hypothetical protein
MDLRGKHWQSHTGNAFGTQTARVCNITASVSNLMANFTLVEIPGFFTSGEQRGSKRAAAESELRSRRSIFRLEMKTVVT